MKARFTARKKVGPFSINIGSRGITSVSVRGGGVTTSLWSKQRGARPRVTSLDTPGLGSVRF